MSRRVEFRVIGDPAPQGSKRHVGNGILVESSKKVGPWRSEVAAEAARHADSPLEGPVSVDLGFRLRMPQSRPKRAGDASWLATRPDVDKLTRAVLDALTTAGVFADDGQVVELSVSKIEVRSSWTGVTVIVRELAVAAVDAGRTDQ